MALTEFRLASGVVYGPVTSRRLGRSLGVNVLPFDVKVCSFNCSYCQCGWTYDTTDHATLSRYAWPTPQEVEAGLAARLQELGGAVDAITLSGNGEPTLHPQFSDCVRAAVRARDRHAPHARTDALTNGANLALDDVVEGLNLLDARYVKLDAGDEAMFMDMNTPVTTISLEEIVEGAARLTDFIAQAMFTRGRIDNTGDENVDRWIETCRAAAPVAVHLYSIARAPADPRLTAVPRDALEAIARRLTERTNIAADVF